VGPSNEAWYVYRSSCVLSLESPEQDRSFDPGALQEEMLFLHGRYGNCEVWNPVIQSYGAFHGRMLSLDFPGFGRSFTMDGCPLSVSQLVEVTIQYILARDQERLVLVGHDLGAAVAQLAALRLESLDPTRIAGLVLLNACSFRGFHYRRLGPDSWLELLKRPSQRRIGQRRLRRLLKSAASRYSHQDFAREMKKLLFAPRRASILSLCESWPSPSEQESIREEMRRFEKPILLLWGSLDSLNPPEHAHELMLTYPDVELFQHDLCGHWPLIEQPEWVARKLKEFLFKLRRAPAFVGTKELKTG
jgi:pimeloyl-ACP methyl ester carboxylesterase